MRNLTVRFLFLVSILFANNIIAEKFDEVKEGYLKADIVYYDKINKVFKAESNVEISTEDRILFADKVTYDKINDKVFAEGNISLLEPNGDVYFGEEVELFDSFKRGIIDKFSAKLIDKSTLIAEKGERIDQDTFILENASYTPCKIPPDGVPQWQLKAKEIKVFNDKQTVKYRNVFLEFGGVPFFYSPFFSHPTPNADRKSGFLKPSYGIISDIGTFIEIPYYFNLDTNKDLTVAAMVPTAQTPVIKAKYRHLTDYGKYEILVSGTNAKNKIPGDDGKPVGGYKFRSHIDAVGDFNFKENYFTGFEINRASDDSYLRSYGFSNANYLTSRVYFDYVNKRDITTSEVFYFQGLLPDDRPERIPLIVPLINNYYESNRYSNGSYFSFNNNLLVLHRGDGVKSRRISVQTAYNMPAIFKTGHQFDLKFKLRGDIYDVENVPSPFSPNNKSLHYDGIATRAIPELELNWQFPLLKEASFANFLIEPMASLMISPYGGNTDKIPNEDSIDIELSDDNLFYADRFAGFDRVETGPRINYGLSGTYYNDNGSYLNVLLGQVYRFKKDSNFDSGSGMKNKTSDYVGRVIFNPNEHLDLYYRFRIANNRFEINRSEVAALVNYNPLSLDIRYASINDPQPLALNRIKRKEIVLKSALQISENWRVGLSGRRNLSKNGGFIETGARLDYITDCVNMSIVYTKDHTKNKNLSRQEKILVSFDLKNLMSLTSLSL